MFSRCLLAPSALSGISPGAPTAKSSTCPGSRPTVVSASNRIFDRRDAVRRQEKRCPQDSSWRRRVIPNSGTETGQVCLETTAFGRLEVEKPGSNCPTTGANALEPPMAG